MDCREFRKKHVGFVDDLLPAVEMDAMLRHLSACSSCSRQDMLVRRSLMLVRSLRPIEPSAGFMLRLNQRIEEIGPVSRVDFVSRAQRLPSIGTFAALAAGIAAVAYMAVETTRYFNPELSPVAPVVAATAAPLPPGASLNAALVASVSTGIPVWPAMLMVGEAPMRFASMDFREPGR